MYAVSSSDEDSDGDDPSVNSPIQPRGPSRKLQENDDVSTDDFSKSRFESLISTNPSQLTSKTISKISDPYFKYSNSDPEDIINVSAMIPPRSKIHVPHRLKTVSAPNSSSRAFYNYKTSSQDEWREKVLNRSTVSTNDITPKPKSSTSLALNIIPVDEQKRLKVDSNIVLEKHVISNDSFTPNLVANAIQKDLHKHVVDSKVSKYEQSRGQLSYLVHHQKQKQLQDQIKFSQM